MDGRKRLSGAGYKRLAKQKTEREKEVLAKIPKLNQFFKAKSHTVEPELVPSSSSAPESVEVEGRYLNLPPNFLLQMLNLTFTFIIISRFSIRNRRKCSSSF